MSPLWLLSAALLTLSPGWSAQDPSVARRRVLAADGTALALYRYGPSTTASRPVLLVPEVGFNRHSYDLHGRGLARWLARRGRTVYVAELRGQGRADAKRGHRLQDWVALDLPAISRAIEAESAGPFDVVAHGFSGSLVLAASGRELRGRVGRVVALSTPVLPEVPNAITAALLREGGKLSRLADDPEGAHAFDLLFAHGSKLPRAELAELRSKADDLGATGAAELLGWMESGDLTLADGSTVSARLAAYDRPTLLFLALRNNFAHPEFASPLREYSRAKVSIRVLTRLELLREDYSHLSLLQGDDAPTDVFAPALKFLDAG